MVVATAGEAAGAAVAQGFREHERYIRALLFRMTGCVADADDGEYLAARRPIHGRNRVARYLLGIRPEPHVSMRSTVCELNGLPALLFDFRWTDRPRAAPRVVIACDVDDDGRIAAFYTVLAAGKLTAQRELELDG